MDNIYSLFFLNHGRPGTILFVTAASAWSVMHRSGIGNVNGIFEKTKNVSLGISSKFNSTTAFYLINQMTAERKRKMLNNLCLSRSIKLLLAATPDHVKKGLI